ncbi:membrane hypothetical protein [uncultured Desulfobacterium sp.]|uniref:Uncharacterized protein n=1 Tax=uncultured Desulfobacterium sp. TaxID=201089 RepID=A0A445MUI0_9BACT|nr:membrane hypothetical protein [uncultured Desulfobacterium sp.]
MLNITIVGALAFIYFSAFFGWGRLVEILLRLRWPLPFTTCLGMSFLIFLGGVLNLAGLAYPIVLDIVIIFGLGISIFTSLRSLHLTSISACKRHYLTSEYLSGLLPSAVLIIIVFGYLTHTVSTPMAFNFHDDLEKYITHPIRMLETGSVKSGPFDVVGVDTLGGQAFLHGFSLAHFPIGYVNTVDAVFAFTLFLMAIQAAAIHERLPFWMIPLTIAIPVFINPQYVNISASFTASALILFVFLGTWLAVKDADNGALSWQNAVFTGLTYSSVASLKTNYVFVAAIHFILLFLGFIFVLNPRKKIISWAVKVGLSVVFFTFPWALLYLPYWLASLKNINNPINASLRDNYFGYTEPASNLFSLKPLSYGFGETFAHYSIVVILIGCYAVFFLLHKHTNQQVNKVRSVTAFAACATIPILYYIGTIATSRMLFGQEDALRFLVPVIIAAVPAALIMVASESHKKVLKSGSENWPLKLKYFVVIFCSVSLLYAFFGSFSERIFQAYKYGSMLAFRKLAISPEYIEYNRFAMSAESKKKVKNAQQVVPEKENLIAWTPLALHLDYKRNNIITVTPSGLVSPWQDFPFGKGTDKCISYLKGLNSYYVLWQYQGFAARSINRLLMESASPFFRHHAIGVRTIQFINFLKNAAAKSQILYNDGEILVMKFSEDKT